MIEIFNKCLKLRNVLADKNMTRSIIGSLNNLARVYDNHIEKWDDTNCTEIIFNIADEYKETEDSRLSACKI